MSDQRPNPIANYGLGVVGMLLGAVAGYFAVNWIADQGFYALALSGAAIGLGCSSLSRIRSLPLAIACGVVGLVTAIAIDWSNAPFIADDSLTYYLTHLHQTRSISKLMIALNVFFAAWFGYGRIYK